MITRELKLTDDQYVELTSSDNFVIQNTSTSILQIIAADTQPDASANGINLLENEAITDKHIGGTIWGLGNCTVIIADV